MNLSGNTILITGGSTGIGLEMAKQFTALKNKVIVTGRNLDKLKKATEVIPGLHTIQSDAGNPEHVKTLLKRITTEFPDTNIIINNAGIMWTINLQKHDFSFEKLTTEIDINLKGPIYMTEAFLSHLKGKSSAAIVNVSSGLAYVPLPISPVYCAAKAALHSYTQSLRAQLVNTKVQVFELLPPATETELLHSFDPNDSKGIPIMKTDKMVGKFIKGLSNDTLEILPGQASMLKFMSRFLPNFIFGQMSKSVSNMHSKG